jgi:hypothetical protein
MHGDALQEVYKRCVWWWLFVESQLGIDLNEGGRACSASGNVAEVAAVRSPTRSDQDLPTFGCVAVRSPPAVHIHRDNDHFWQSTGYE